MGNCCSFADAEDPASSRSGSGSSAGSAARYNAPAVPGAAAVSPRAFSSGGRLGGDEVVAQLAPRDAAAMAAEARAAAAKPREDRLKREDLVGKLLEAHRRKGLSPPLNLASLPLAQLAAMNEQMGLRR
jgi:hypothetical protein